MASNNEKIEITKTELRSLILWASVGVRKMRGGTYGKIVVKFIRNNYNIMPFGKKIFKYLEFGSNLKN